MKKIISLISVLAIILSLFAFGSINASAASASLQFSSSSVEVGSKVTVTVILQNGSEMIDASCKINYNEAVLRYDSGTASGGAGLLTYVSDKSSSKYTISLNFTAIAVGESNIQVKDCVYTYLGSNGAAEEGFGGQSATISVKDKALSSNANLKSLKLNTGSISPKFSANKTSYTAQVKYDITKVNVTAAVEDSGAKVVSVSGNTNLKVGKNNVVVTVQAANGAQKKYTIVVTRLEQNETVSSETESTEGTTSEASPLETVIEDVAYTIATEIPEDKLFSGFTVSTEKYNDVDVSVAVDSKEMYKLYYLKAADSEELIPYTYDSELKTFKKLKYIVLGTNLYIFEDIPEDYKAYDDLYESNVKIGEYSIKCFSSNDEKLNEFHYVYCYSGGEQGIYRYDSLQGTLQRYPEFRKVTVNEIKPEVKDNLLTRFLSLSSNGKIIIIGFLIAILGALTLVVFLIIFIVKKLRKNDDNLIFDSFEEDFDEIEEDLDNTEE